MMCGPSTYAVNTSPHVTVAGLPSTITDERLQYFFSKFGPVQRLFRPAENQKLVCVTFIDAEAAVLACGSEHYDVSTPYEVKLSSKWSIPESDRSHSSGRSSPDFYDPSLDDDQTEEDPDYDIPVKHLIIRRESNEQDLQSSNHGDYWAGPDVLHSSVACVTYEVDTNPLCEEFFNCVKKCSKQSGNPSHILKREGESTTIIEVQFTSIEDDNLECDHKLIFDREAKVRIFYPPQRDPWEEPSTSKETITKGDQLLSATCSIHVSNLERHEEEHFRRRFESYGRIIDIEILKSTDNEEVAVIQFTNIDEAHRAMSDANHPKPMSYSSRPNRRLILFYLPRDTNEAIMLTIRGLSNKIEDITVDWIARNAVITFESNGHAIQLFKEMRIPDTNNFGEHKVGIDYCSERLHRFFLQKRDENLIEARNSSVPSEIHLNSLPTAPSTSSCTTQQEVIEKAQMSRSPTRYVTLDEDDDIQILSCQEGSSSTENIRHSSDSGNEDDDRIREEEEEYNDEYEYVNINTRGPSHEQDGSQSPRNELHDEFNDNQRFVNEPCDEPNDEMKPDYIDLILEASTSRYNSSEKYSNGYRRKSSSPPHHFTSHGYGSNSPTEESGSSNNYIRFQSNNSRSVSTYAGSSEDDNLTPTDDNGSSVCDNGSQVDDNKSGNDGNGSQSTDNRSQANDNRSQQSNNSRSSANNTRSPRGGNGSHGYRRDDDDDDDDDDEDKKPECKFECDPSTSTKEWPPVQKIEVDDEFPDTQMSKMVQNMQWKPPVRMPYLINQLDRLTNQNQNTRANYEKWTGRPFPKFTEDGEMRLRRVEMTDSRDYYYEASYHELDLRMREWRKISEFVEMEELRSLDPKELQRDMPLLLNKSSGRPSLDESRFSRFSFDSHHPAELAQRSHSLCVGPMTPAAPYPTTTPLLVNTSHHHGTSQPSASGVTTPRSAQPPILMSPLSRHNSVSSVGRPANIQTHRHHSHVVPIDTTVPPPMIPANNDVVIPPRDASSRRSSETLAPLRSPPFVNQNPIIGAIPPSASQMMAATGTHSVSSSAHSTPRHSISGTPVHYEPSISKCSQPQTPKTNKPEKVQVRHDSISKPGPSSAANALQGRSQSMTAGDYKKSNPSTPAYRDAGSDLVAQIMSNQPTMGFKKLPRIEKKPSALHNLHNQQNNIGSTPSTPASVHQAMLLKDKEKERRRKDRQLEREREARKEMKRKETKEERNKRKEMERAKRDEDERRERKREKQRMKEKEERRKEKERERKKSEREKHKKKKHRRDDDSDESDSSSNDELDLDAKKSTKEMTQEEKDHQLALILSKGSIIENLKSRRRSDKRHDPIDKSQQKNQNLGTRRVLIESSDDNEEDEDDDEKEKSNSSSGEASDTDKRTKQVPSSNLTVATAAPKELKQKVQKEREKGELSSSEDEENRQEKDYELQQKLNVDRENRKRQKSLTTYSSDEHGERKTSSKRVRRDDSEDALRSSSWGTKDDRNQRKRKLVNRLSSEDESRRKAKQRDFRDIPHEDVSDEEEVEVASRVRRQSSSSTASNKESLGKREKSGKTPLRVTTPARAPLQSPKLLSPKILSPKTSTISTKRPSISDQESIVSPRVRNRTTSSTSTATTSSKHETTSIPDKPLSPPVTAKNSVSSIDDFAIRDEFSSNSAVCSPMSSTGRPMVLTKAAMKVFNSSPPKKQSSSSGPRDFSSGSSSSSSSGSSSSSSSDDSSDEETSKTDAPVIVVNHETEKPNEVLKQEIHMENRSDKTSLFATEIRTINPLSVVAAQEEEVTETEEEPVVQADEPSTTLPITVTQTFDVVHEVSPPHDSKPIDDEKGNEEENTSEQNEVSVLQIEHDQNQESSSHDVEPDPAVVEPERKKESGLDLEPENEVAPVVEEHLSPKRMDVILVAQEEPPSTHTLISDQETDQAVQSIFDEEEADEFPQYPDFVMTKDDKEASEKKLSSQESVETEDPKSTSADYPLTNGHSSNYLLSPSKTASTEESIPKTLEEPEIVPESEEIKIEKEVNSEDKTDETAVPASVSPTEIEVDVEDDLDQDEDEDLKIVESPEATPTPELIPNDKTQDVHKEHSPVQPMESESTKREDIEQAKSPVQPNELLEVSVSQPDHPIVRPSPRHVIAPVPQPSTVEPMAVLHQPHLEKPSPIPAMNLQKELQLVDEYLVGRRITDLVQLLDKNAHLQNFLTKELKQRIQDLLHHSSMNMPEGGNCHPFVIGQNQQQALLMAQQKQREQEEYQRRTEEERKQREEAERRKAVDRIEMERRSEQQISSASFQRQFKSLEKNDNDMNHLLNLMPLEARKFYNNLPGFPSRNFPETNGIVNGNHPFIQQLHRPSSTASTSSTSARTPLQPSTSINQRNIGPESAGAQVQRWFYSNFPMVWTGRLSLKSTDCMINLHLVNGSETFLNDVLGRQINDENPRRDSMKIVQRLRLDNGQVEHIHSILTNPDYACCIALSSVTDYNVDDIQTNEATLKASVIDYLNKKQIAGVSSLEEVEMKFKSARVHVFAKGDIVDKYLSELAAPLHNYLTNTETRFLLIVFTNDKIEPNMDGPPSIETLTVPTLSSS